jgi:hypothetical protein
VIDGYVPPPDQQLTLEYNEISPEFLATIGIPLAAGRDFTHADDEGGLPVAIVDETMARQFWPRQDAVGRRIQLKGQWLQVVGVAANAKYSNLLETPKPFFYVPLRQHFSPTTALHVRTTASAAALAPTLVREIHRLDAGISPSELITMREQIDRTTASQRVALTMLVASAVSRWCSRQSASTASWRRRSRRAAVSSRSGWRSARSQPIWFAWC